MLPDRSKERSVIISFVSILLWFNTPTDVSVSLTQIKVYTHKCDNTILTKDFPTMSKHTIKNISAKEKRNCFGLFFKCRKILLPDERLTQLKRQLTSNLGEDLCLCRGGERTIPVMPFCCICIKRWTTYYCSSMY